MIELRKFQEFQSLPILGHNIEVDIHLLNKKKYNSLQWKMETELPVIELSAILLKSYFNALKSYRICNYIWTGSQYRQYTFGTWLEKASRPTIKMLKHPIHPNGQLYLWLPLISRFLSSKMPSDLSVIVSNTLNRLEGISLESFLGKPLVAAKLKAPFVGYSDGRLAGWCVLTHTHTQAVSSIICL